MEADFSGYATKANLKCSDGRTIMPDAFKHQDKVKVPLVWQHAHNEPDNVLGHVLLENRTDGVYCYGFFNDTDKGKGAKKLVVHEDINALSIYANQLVERGKVVFHGVIREVSLVLAGANDGAKIDFVNIAHADGSMEELEDEAVIYTGLQLQHASLEDVQHADDDDDDRTVQDVFDTFTDDQKNVVYYLLSMAQKGSGDAEHFDMDTIPVVFESMTDVQQKVVHYLIGEALQASATESKTSANAAEDPKENTAEHADTNKEGTVMANVFEQNSNESGKVSTGKKLSHADELKIFKDAHKSGSLRAAVESYAETALQHGIDDIDILFPDARAISSTPEFIKRRTEWVAEVLTGTRHTPFARIKSLAANLTFEEARAKGYIKGTLKKEEFFRVSKRVTTPQTIYKKQQLDRDDILDITDFDVVAWLKGEMRLMLEEEIARAILIGDGRSGEDEDKIKEENVRPIATDSDLYVTVLNINLGDANSSNEEIIDTIVLNRRHYRGSGNPTLFCGETIIASLLSIKDTLGRRIYPTMADLLAVLRVSKIVPVEVMDSPSSPVVAIMVNLQDYTVGSDKGGDVSLFDDFDIDYNQYKYLIETRISGALTRPKSALVIKKVASNATLVDPVAPSWNAETRAVTVATTTGVTYKNKATGGTLVTGTPVVLSEGDELVVHAVPASASYYLASNAADEFRFTYDRGRVDDAY